MSHSSKKNCIGHAIVGFKKILFHKCRNVSRNLQQKLFFLVKENRKKYPRIRTLVSPLLSLSDSLYKILVLPISQHHTLFYKKNITFFSVYLKFYIEIHHSFIQLTYKIKIPTI